MNGHNGWLRAALFTLCALILVFPALVLADVKLHPAMQATWERSDLLVANGEVARSSSGGRSRSQFAKNPTTVVSVWLPTLIRAAWKLRRQMLISRASGL